MNRTATPASLLGLFYFMSIEDLLFNCDEITWRNGYERLDHQENIGLAIYQDNDCQKRINIYLTKMTVIFYRKNEKKQLKPVLTVKKCSLQKLETIIKNSN